MNEFENVDQSRKPNVRKRLALLLLSICVIGFFVLGAAMAYRLVWNDVSPEPPRTPLFDERSACRLLVSVGADGAEQILNLVAAPDGTTVNWSRLGTVVDDLRTIRSSSPADMSADIDQQIDGLQQILDIRDGRRPNGSVDFGTYRASGLRIAGRCSKYTH